MLQFAKASRSPTSAEQALKLIARTTALNRPTLPSVHPSFPSGASSSPLGPSHSFSGKSADPAWHCLLLHLLLLLLGSGASCSDLVDAPWCFDTEHFCFPACVYLLYNVYSLYRFIIKWQIMYLYARFWPVSSYQQGKSQAELLSHKQSDVCLIFCSTMVGHPQYPSRTSFL